MTFAWKRGAKPIHLCLAPRTNKEDNSTHLGWWNQEFATCLLAAACVRYFLERLVWSQTLAPLTTPILVWVRRSQRWHSWRPLVVTLSPIVHSATSQDHSELGQNRILKGRAGCNCRGPSEDLHSTFTKDCQWTWSWENLVWSTTAGLIKMS